MMYKRQWVEKFEELLWKHHTCDWEEGNKNPDYPLQLAVAYFDWAYDGTPLETVEEAFERYLKTLEED